jgi:hypothetical protein
MHEQLLKGVTRDGHSIKLRANPNRRMARLVGNEGGLTENVATVKLGDSLPSALYLRLAPEQ